MNCKLCKCYHDFGARLLCDAGKFDISIAGVSPVMTIEVPKCELAQPLTFEAEPVAILAEKEEVRRGRTGKA